MPDIFRAGKFAAMLFLVIIFVGCAPQEPLPGQAVGTKPPQSPTLEQSTKSGSSPVTPTLNNMYVNASPTPERLLTKTAEPTRDIQQQKAHILDLIRTNADCKFPCFLSITPGQSTWEMAKTFILSTGAKYSDKIESDGIHHFTGYNTKDIQIPLDIEYLDVNGVIEYISGGIGDLGNTSSTVVDWTPYKISTILSTYGIPSKILLDIYKPVDPSTTTAYEMWMIYDDIGFIIKYGGENVTIEDHYRICPNSLDTGDIYGFVAFFKSTNTKWPETVTEMMSTPKDLEKVTDLTVGDFYKKYASDSAQVCFTSSQSNW
jgi:hypothetical protein